MTSAAIDHFRVGRITKVSKTNLRQHLHDHGLAIFQCSPLSMATALLSAAEKLGTLHLHPHGNTDGTTTIAPRESYDALMAGAGFSRARLSPHTDASAIEFPPAFVLNGCVSSAAHGGATLLTNMRAVFETLEQEDPSAANLFAKHGSMIFGVGANAQSAAIFEKSADRVKVRFRSDAFGFIPANLARQFCRILDMIDRLTIVIDLTPGSGYIIDNHWWLHGRTEFEGDREVIRVLVDRKATDDLKTGFGIDLVNFPRIRLLEEVA